MDPKERLMELLSKSEWTPEEEEEAKQLINDMAEILKKEE